MKYRVEDEKPDKVVDISMENSHGTCVMFVAKMSSDKNTLFRLTPEGLHVYALSRNFIKETGIEVTDTDRIPVFFDC